MDVYGYPPYQYNQSDELANQICAQQVLESPYNPGMIEPHNMPAPTGTPWNSQGLKWGMQSPPHLVQFTGAPITEIQASPVIHCKRKSLDIEPVIPAKQFITEDKMAAHLNSLHISSEYTAHSLQSDVCMDVGVETSSTPSISEKLKGHRIILSEEVKKLKEEPLLPPSLIERLEKPHMSLVVWKPREKILEDIVEDKKKELEEMKKLEEMPKRNGVLVTDFPGMDVEM